MSNNVMEYYDNLIVKPKKIYIVVTWDDLDGSDTIDKAFLKKLDAIRYIENQKDKYLFRIIEQKLE